VSLHVPENAMTIGGAMDGRGARGDRYSVHLCLRGPHRCSHKGGTAMSTVDAHTSVSKRNQRERKAVHQRSNRQET